MQVKKGDKVKVMRGQFRGREGKVEKVNLKHQSVFVSGLDYIKKDGSKVPLSFHPSNLMLMELDLSDKRRKEKIEEKKGKLHSPSSAHMDKNNVKQNTKQDKNIK